ncbi:MAG: GNAT family N-acetyltransferase [Pseudomonadota bacterium]
MAEVPSLPISRLARAVWVTWPGEDSVETPAFTLRRSRDDSRRSRAASAHRDVSDAEIAQAAEMMAGWGQPAMFWVPSDAPALDAQLARLNYRSHDGAHYYLIEAASLAARPIPPVTTFEIWEPLAIMADIWAEQGTSRARQEVMARAKCPRVSIFGRVDARPAAAAYIGADGEVAMLHALVTLPQHRRKGLGGHVMAQAARWASRQGCRWLGLAVSEGNIAARALYASLGMVAVGSYAYRSRETR